MEASDVSLWTNHIRRTKIVRFIMQFLKSITHPDEVLALFKFKMGGGTAVMPKYHYESMSEELKTCYEFLNKTSRSFAAVIQALDGELRDAVCIFYLVLRALDTVEDDMSIPRETKIPMLQSFYTHLYDPTWTFNDSTEKDKIVLEQFPVISIEFLELDAMYQEVIADICKRMGEGMCVYLDRAPGSLAEWDEYCHYVAGLVGIGLSRLFSASGLEDVIVGKDTRLSNSMGLFLQKTNIIRDYLEDVVQGREFWPKAVWGKYTTEMIDLSRPHRKAQALACLNELITNALQHIPDVIKYMSRLKNQSIFNFCAIPQVMAVATLERCYNNYNVFTGVVKIRKGEAVRLMMEATTLNKVKAIMTHFATNVSSRVPKLDPTFTQTQQVCSRSLSVSSTHDTYDTSHTFLPIYVSCSMLLAAILWQYWTAVTSIVDNFMS